MWRVIVANPRVKTDKIDAAVLARGGFPARDLAAGP
jgi:hypothetical protein